MSSADPSEGQPKTWETTLGDNQSKLIKKPDLNVYSPLLIQLPFLKNILI